MRKALIVGIDYYKDNRINNLNGCVNDSRGVKSVLERNSDDSKNFDVLHLEASDENTIVTKREMKDSIVNLFQDNSDIALLYFSGHGYVDATAGYILLSDAQEGDEGVSLAEILKIANASAAKNKIIVLDSCHSGEAGNVQGDLALLNEGVTILTASAKNQYAFEEEGSGVFTSLFIDALNGAGANLVGEVSPGSVYAHIDQSLGAWDQRPIFKTNVRTFISLRNTTPPIAWESLKRIAEYFPEGVSEFQLDPDYEPESETPDKEKCQVFALLQEFSHVNLVKPVGEKHMYFAAMNSKSCKLTALGEHYRSLALRGKL